MIASRISKLLINISREWTSFATITLAQGVFGPQGQFIGESLELQNKGTLALSLDVTALSGTNPALDVDVQTSEDGVTTIDAPDTWVTVASFPRVIAIGHTRQVFTGIDAFARVVITISGTNPSFTLGVTGKGY